MNIKSGFLVLAGIVVQLVGCEYTPTENDRKTAEARDRMWHAFGNAMVRHEDGESYENRKKRLAKDGEEKKNALLKNNMSSATKPVVPVPKKPGC